MSEPPERAARSGQPGVAGAAESHATGRWGEDLAVACLQREGCRILGRRVRPDRRDEIDIVARKDDALIFVEVKTRRNEAFGRPLASVDAAKRRALNRAAVRYLRQIGFPRLYYRFDTIEIVGAPGDAAPVVRHIENAFPFSGRHMLGT